MNIYRFHAEHIPHPQNIASKILIYDKEAKDYLSTPAAANLLNVYHAAATIADERIAAAEEDARRTRQELATVLAELRQAIYNNDRDQLVALFEAYEEEPA